MRYKIHTRTDLGIIGGYQVKHRPDMPWDKVVLQQQGGTTFATKEEAYPILAQARAGWPEKEFVIMRDVFTR